MSTASFVAEKPKMEVAGRFYLSYVLFSLLIFPVHELGHYSAYRIMGVQLQMTLNTASPRDPSLRKPIAELAGPLVNLVIVLVAAATFHVTGRKWRWLGTLALAAAMMRLVIYALVVSAALVTGSGLTLGNDEPISAHLWGLPSLTIVAILAVPFGTAVWSIVRTFQGNASRKALHVIAFALITFGVGMFIGNFLDPRLFPNR